MAKTTKQAGDSTATLTCPECGRTFTRAAALGAHRRMTHGVAGTSANASTQRKRTASRARTTSSAPTPRGRRRTAPATSNGNIDRDALLVALFPNGIPPRQEVIVRTNAWLDEAEQLASS
jgi:hypothetical protein